jgi:hypothetical protein
VRGPAKRQREAHRVFGGWAHHSSLLSSHLRPHRTRLRGEQLPERAATS